MKKQLITLATLLTFTASTGSVMAHSLWVNVHESFTHPPGHFITSLGWGHEVPMDDFLMSEAGAVTIETYDLMGPDGSRTPFPLPVIKKETPASSTTGMTIVQGDLGLRKVSLTDKTVPGTYAVIAESKATYFSGYVDKKGNHKMATKAMDEIKGATAFDFSTRYKAVAKSYVGIKKWTAPKPAGFDLEIMPDTDLSTVNAGDIVKFTVTFKGKPLNCDMHGIHILHLTSNTYGGPDKFMLSSYIMNGKAQVRIPTAGEWVASILIKKNVTPDNELKALAKKCQSIYYGSTLSLTAKP
ncbi:MAG: hypothetical protein CSA22_03030 [Deltaproteobacteria bacterium]|nr:MAG: hypothetical protein CSA22_03030 [Deltaproteobacteria bacterium]